MSSWVFWTERKTILKAYIAGTLVVLLSAVPLWLFAYSETGFLGSLAVRGFWWISCFVLLILYFLAWFGLPRVESSPGASLRALAHMMRVMKYSVDEAPKWIDIRVDKLTQVKVRARGAAGGTRIEYQVGATPVGATFIVVMFLIFPPASAIASLFIFGSAFRFVDTKVAPRLAGLPAVVSAPMDVKATLIDSLSEGHRLAQEASESVKSNYEDLIIIILVSGIAFFFGGFLAAWWLQPPDMASSDWSRVPVAVGAMAMLAFTLPSLWRARSRHKKAIGRFERSVSLLGGALASETSSLQPPDGFPSSFEIIAGAWDEVPSWLAARRRAGMFRHPSIWTAIVVFAYSGFLLLVAGIAELLYPGIDYQTAGVIVALGSVMVVSTMLLYFRWSRDQKLESERIVGDWRRRVEILRSEMEKYLQGL